MKPLIAIIANQYDFAEKVFHNHPATYVPQFYIDAVYAAGGTPVILPLVDREDAGKYVEHFDGFLLTGGQGASPFLYGEEPQPLMGQTSLRRDEFELDIIQAVRATEKPILGVCRGMQMLNVGLGGTLWQDLAYRKEPVIKHMQVPTPDTQASHYVDLTEGTYLSAALGKTHLVNSLHSQALKDVAAGFTVIARAHDDVVEAVQSNDPRHRIFGVQWHPEMLYTEDQAQLAPFKHLVALAGE